ncbi:MAG: carboxypeptidase regulatory-like domain-containing protein [Candidatus Sulfotelmatobacter sp.]
MKQGVRSFRTVASVLALFGLFAILPSILCSQTATTGAVIGVVSDPSSALVKGASVTLSEPATGTVLSATTDSGGRFAFPAVNPGDYVLKVEAKGFRTSLTNKIVVEVNKSNDITVKLEVGAPSEVVEVTASTMTELQTQDASVGEVLSGTELNRLPVQGRSAAQLIFYQPGVAPDMGTGDTTGGQIAGARSEQITFNIDGGDATSDLEGSNNYASPNQESSAVSPVVPIPQDAVEEFRVATNNANSTFGESSGGQVSVLTKSGTNAIHGSLYEYHSDNGLNASGWNNDHTVPVTEKPPLVDNRFGVAVGGPIIKDKLFYYGFYEGRRFHDQTGFNFIVPSAQLKSGIISFNGVNYNFNPANGPLTAACGGPCDPRGLGVSPVVMAQLALLPNGNNVSEGDGVNTIGYDTPLATPISTNVGKLKLNYNFNSKWSAFVSWQYSSTARTGTEQFSLLGTPHSVSADPYFANFYTFQLQGQLSPTFLSVTHGSFLKNWWGWSRLAPAPLVPGTDAALQISGEDPGQIADYSAGGELFTNPININTQQARPRVWDGHDWYFAQNFTKIHGSHEFQFGGEGRVWYDYHKRTDQVLGGLTTAPIYYVQSSNLAQGAYATIGAANQPVGLPAGDDGFWNGYYASLLGIVDHSSQVETRNGNFVANPLGTPTIANYTLPTFTGYLQDVWKARKNLTITAGLNWGVNLPPEQGGGLASVVVYGDSNTPVNMQQFLKSRGAAEEEGQAYNPLLGVSPVDSLSSPWNGKMRQGIWKNIGPRIAAAWSVNPTVVVRGGYSLVWDRTSAVTSVLSGLLAGGLAQVDECGGPTFNAPGAAPTCSNSSTNPATAFRIGPDGASVPVPGPTNLSIPYAALPTNQQPYSFGADPFITPGYAHAIDFTVQKALQHNLFLEVGYIGRFSRNLSNNEQFNAPDYRTKDPVSGQTYAQAFDALDRAFLAGTTPAPQPFFENLMATTGPNAVCAPGTCTGLAYLLMPSVGPGDLGFFDYLMNLPGVLGPASSFTTPTSNNQMFEAASVTDGGFSDYNAAIVTLRKAMSHGLQFQFNYTWSHAIGNQGTNQQYIYSSESPYNYNLDKSSETFDHRQTVTAFWYYDLPFGKGRSFASGSNVLDKYVIGGWNVSGIFNFFTGSPDCVGSAGGDYGSFFEESCAVLSGGIPSTATPTSASSIPKWGVNSNVTGTVNGAPLAGSLNIFSNPAAVYNSLQYPLLSGPTQIPHDQMYSFPYWNVDFSLGKRVPVTERVGLVFTADAFNIFNHVVLNSPSLDLDNPGAFGVLSSQFAPGISLTGARTLQLSFRVEF